MTVTMTLAITITMTTKRHKNKREIDDNDNTTLTPTTRLTMTMTLDNGYDEGINDCDDYDNIVGFTEKTIIRKFRKKGERTRGIR